MRALTTIIRAFRVRRWGGVMALFALAATPAAAQVTAGYSEYYVPGGEDEMHLAFRTMGGGTISASTHATITITAWADDTTVYYDHWENGLGFAPANPGTTADETFTLGSVGSVLVLDDTPAGGIPIPRNPANTFYDGGDRIYVAGGAVTVTRASYPQVRAGVNPGLSVQAVAWEVYPVKPQLTTYILPFGENLSGSFPDFLRTYVLVQATADDTTFTVDLNGDGTADRLDQNFDGDTTDPGDTTTVTLQLAGETFFLGNVPVNPNPMPRGARATVNSGAVIQGSSTLQVKFVIGDPGATYETRGISAFPRGYWTQDYYAPVNEPAAGPVTDIFLYNPNAGTLTVDWETQAGSGSFTIGSGATVSYLALAGALPTTGGVYLRGSDVFWGVSTIDSTGPTNEWAYSLLPTTLLYSEHYLGWAPGGADGNDSGVFLTVVQDNTRVFVDTDGDGTADQTYTLDRLQTQYITDPDGDLSGTRFWATGPFTMSFGQNPDTAPAQALSGDLGYVAIPGTDFISLVLAVHKSASPQVVSTAAGAQATFTIEVESGAYSVDGVSVLDILPPGWRYVSGSTEITLADLTTVSGAAADPTPTPSYADLFNAVSYANDDSTPAGTSWATDWTEDGENNGTDTDNVRVLTDTGVVPNVTALRFRNDDRALARMADLSLFTGATVQFLYRRQGTDDVDDSLDVQVCADATYNAAPTGITCAGGWVDAPAVQGFGGTDAAYQAYSIDLGSLLPGALGSPTFALRFSTLGGDLGGFNDFIWIDDVRIVPKGDLTWPASTLGSMAPNQTIRITFTAETTVPLAEGTLSENRVTAVGTRTVGGVVQTFTTTHFAFVLSSDSGVEISKDSSVEETTPVYPGDPLTYTVTVTNPGGAMLTGVSLYDALPPGVTMVPGSTMLSASSSGDRFETTSYNNSDGTRAWDGAWTEVDNGSAATGDILITGGQLRLNGDGAARSITRGVDLGGTGATWAALTFDYTTSNNLEAGDLISVQYRTGGGGGWTTLVTYADDVSGSATLVIPLASPANQTEIRFAIPANDYTGGGEYFYVDNLFLTYDQPVTGGDPPALLSGSSGYAIPAGESLTATFDVTVDDPLATGITSLTNTASTTSSQFPIQVSDSVTNIVTNPSIQSASVAGRVWLDADGDGAQDFGEPGIANVAVTLKDRWGTPLATLYTDVGGRYLFPGVEPGDGYYVEVEGGLPAGVAQSFPDAATYGAHRSVPFELLAGENETGVDLGYRPAAGTALFGDQVWVDANANGLRDAGEVALAGATIDLFLDANGNGVLDAGEVTPLASTTSDASGHYVLGGSGLSGGEDYFVGVRAVTGYSLTTAGTYYFQDVIAGSAYLTADFGFVGSTVTTYTISDRVWFDMDGSQAPNGTETGIAGVTVDLLDASLNVIATAITAADGTFSFSGVRNGNYTVRISDTSGVLANHTGTTSWAVARQRAESVASASVDRTASPSYGFRPTRSIGDTVFFDTNGNGSQDAGEGGIPGIVVGLYQGVTLLYSTTTDANGRYFFAGLGDGGYVVSVPELTGYAFTGTDAYPAIPGLQLDATIAGGASYWDADFGFQATTPRALSGIVWNDADGDGAVDAGETGISGVTLDVLSGAIVIATVLTDADGTYSVQGLAAGPYTVQLTDDNGVLTGLMATYEGVEGVAGVIDLQEPVDLTDSDIGNVNFGYRPPEVTFANVASFRAYLAEGAVVVEWRTSLEVGTVGFRLFRLDPAQRAWRPLGERLLPGLVAHPAGGTYRVVDDGAEREAGARLTYLLEEVDLRGRRQAHGPYTVALSDEDTAVATDARRAAAPRGARFDRAPAAISRAARVRAAAASAERRVARRVGQDRRGGWIEVATGAAGLYYVSAEQIAAPVGALPAAVSGLIATRRLTVSHRERPVRYLPEPQNAGIFFYAEPVASAYTAENVYQIGLGAGQTVEEVGTVRRNSLDWRGALATSFEETLHSEQDSFADMAVIQDPEGDFWFWGYAFAGFTGLDTATVTVRAEGVSGTGTASLVVNLVGGSDEAAETDHHVIVSWNGSPVAESSWGGLGPHAIEVPLAPDDVLEGENTLAVRAVRDAGVAFSLVYLDSVDLRYARLYLAVGDEISFSAPPGAGVQVGGFSSPDVLLFDVTKPATPKRVAHSSAAAPDGSYAIRFGVPGARQSARYFAVATSRVKAPLQVAASRMPFLRRSENRAEYVLIAPDALEEPAQALADYRNATGITTLVVPLAAIYSEFNGGIVEPTAVREFLRYAVASWQTPPRYVTLVGRGTWDYKDLNGVGDNLVPPLMAVSPNGLFASDVRLADIAGDDGVPEVAIGRLPVLTAQELLDYIAKIERHERAPADAWQRSALMAADNPDAGGSFTADSDAVTALLPADHIARKVYLTTTTPAAGRAAIRDAINGGVGIFNYIGHGGLDRLADESLWASPDVVSLVNEERLPIVLYMTCAAGNFAVPGFPSLAEAMVLKEDGGAFAVWAPTGLSENAMAVQLDKSFFSSAFASEPPRVNVVGDIVVRALAELRGWSAVPMRYMYNLLGEPVSRLPEAVEPAAQ